MKNTYKFIVAILLSGMAFLHASAGHLTSELLVTAKLTGAQEVPPVTTNAVGLASFTINEGRDSVNFNIVVNGLSGEITGAHIHEAAIGANGGVVINLSSFIKGNQLKGSIPASDVTQTFISGLLSGKYYVNVHTKDNAGGEIRGQLNLETDMGFYASLDTAQQNHAVTTNAYGSAYFDVSIDRSTLTYYVATQDLSGDITAAHLHEGAVGQTGGVLANLSAGINGKQLEGTLDISSNSSLVTKILNGQVYINIHTTANANGEIRGQVKMTKGLAFDSKLTTDQETTTVVGSSAFGAGHLALNTTLDTLWYSFLAADLSGTITGAHIHQGAVGTSGSVLLNLSSSINGNWVEGMVTGSSLTNAVINAMLSGETYINVHTTLNPNGEIRGQLYRTAREGYSYDLTGGQEVPAAMTNGVGVGIISVDRNQTNAHYMFVVDNLSGPISGAHLHNAAIGANGGVVFDLTSAFEKKNNYDGAFGYWTSKSSTAFQTANSLQLRNETNYINIHTAAYAGGELRGQADRGFASFFDNVVDNGKLPFDPSFNGQMLFTARLSGANEVPSVNTDATGVVGVLISADFKTVTINATFSKLSSAFTGAHIHEASAGANGGVVADLSSFVNGNQIKGELTSLDLEKLAMGMYYLNIHSEDFPNGEIRGQLALEKEISFIADIKGGQEVPPVITLGNGLGHFYLAQNNTALKFKVVYDGLSGPITGVHLHNAAKGSNGGVVANLTTMIQGNTIMGTIDPSSFLTDLLAGNVYINIHTSLNANGEIRGQLNPATGYVYESWMNGKQATPSSNTTARGLAIFQLDYKMENMDYWVNTAGLSGDITAMHVHNGSLGNSGGVALNLATGITGKIAVGSFVKADISANVLTMLNTGELYLNAHTLAFPNGEIRGQLFTTNRSGYSFNQCGAQQNPAVNSTGYGSTILAIDRDNSFMHMMMVNTNLSEEVTAAHIHEGSVGNSGGVLFGLSLSGDNYFAYADTTAGYDTSMFRIIKEGNAYVNIHTASNPNGELRGQIDDDTECPTAPATVGVEDVIANSDFAIYPNPASSALNIAITTSTEPVLVKIIDLRGVEVYREVMDTSKPIDISTIESGIYILSIQLDGNNFSERFVKR